MATTNEVNKPLNEKDFMYTCRKNKALQEAI